MRAWMRDIWTIAAYLCVFVAFLNGFLGFAPSISTTESMGLACLVYLAILDMKMMEDR